MITRNCRKCCRAIHFDFSFDEWQDGKLPPNLFSEQICLLTTGYCDLCKQERDQEKKDMQNIENAPIYLI